MLCTGAGLLTDRQRQRLDAAFADYTHTPVAVTQSVKQQIVTDTAPPTMSRRRAPSSLGRGVPAGLPELTTLRRSLTRRGADVLAYFDRPRTINGPTEAINSRLEHLRGTALGSATSSTTPCAHSWTPAAPARLHRLLR